MKTDEEERPVNEMLIKCRFRCGICHVDFARRAARATCGTRGVDASTSTQASMKVIRAWTGLDVLVVSCR